MSCGLAGAALPFSATAASAAPGSVVFSDASGTSAPAATLGPYEMTPFAADTQGDTTVSSVAAPGGGSVGNAPSLNHCTVGECWATWSHGYTGDVYVDGSQSLSLTLPAGTRAFYFYAEPDQFDTFDFTATSSDGTSSGAVGVNGVGGAEYFGFYATGAATLTSITLSETDPDGFGIGEFGISNGVEHVVVNAEAWIPQSQVADPYLPVSLPYLATTLLRSKDPNCYTPSPRQEFSTYVISTYVGDGHSAFGTGTYRLRTEVSFDFDPVTEQITNFTQDSVAPYDAGYYHKVYKSAAGAVLDTCNVPLTTYYRQTAQQKGRTSFTLGYLGINPLGEPAPPALSASIDGTVTSDGGVGFRYATSEFPSQGIQVTFSGNIVVSDTYSDVSCLSPGAVLGFGGRTLMQYGLDRTEHGSVTIESYDNATESTPSPLCRP
jgi:hypothetical protein